MIKAKPRVKTPDPARREVVPLFAGLSGAAAVKVALLKVEPVSYSKSTNIR